MIAYFGRDANGYFADEEDGSRHYIPEDLWLQYIRAGAHVGADISEEQLRAGGRLRLNITQQVKLEKFDADGNLIQTIEGEPESNLMF